MVSDGRTAAYCKVNVEIEGTYTSEVHLPVSGWTQRFLVGGGPGASAATSGFATMNRADIGNRGNEDVFAKNYNLRIDFAYRLVHLQVLASKALITKFYGQGPRYSYWNACSEPGREGMMEVQRYPEDFDGAVTGCPPINNVINQGIYNAWNIRTNTKSDGSLIVTSDKLPLIHKAVLDECDALDGAVDGIVSDPFSCHPKLTAIECKAGQDQNACLTPEQIHVALELYRGAHDDQGNKLEPFGVLPGSEMQWTAVITAGQNSNDRKGTLFVERSEFPDPALGTDWQLSQLKFDRADFERETKTHYLYDATNPNLAAFAKAGHKLIIWQGLLDNNVLPAHSILYFTALQKTLGEKTVDSFARLYLLPGVGHCGGGDGPSIRDFLAPLMAWVERGVAPGALQASHSPQPARHAGEPNGPGGPGGRGGGFMGQGGQQSPGIADLTRPVYPYPYSQNYVGTGSVKDAASFVQGPANPIPTSLLDWLGSDFYKPAPLKWCTATGPTTLVCKNSR